MSKEFPEQHPVSKQDVGNVAFSYTTKTIIAAIT